VNEPEWIIKAVVLALLEEQLAEHGGRAGLRDEGLLDSALSRPQHQYAYDNPDSSDLAAAYAYGLAKNHPFLDGNKRASLVTCETFLLINGLEVTATEAAKLTVWLTLADGTLSEKDLAQWIRKHSRPLCEP
jgi:death on curing protein